MPESASCPWLALRRLRSWMLTSSSSVPAWPGWSPPPSWPTRAGGCCCSTRRTRPTSAARRSGRFGGLFLVDSPEQRRMGIKDSRRPRLAGLGGHRRLRPAGRTAPAGPLGRGSGRGPTSTSRPARSAPGCTSRACAGSRSSGWAERGDGTGRRARQLGAALPHHLGHRPGRRRAVRAAGPRARGDRPGRAPAPAPGRRADRRPAARSTGVRGAVLAPDATRRAACRRPRRRRRLRAHAPRPSSSPPAASAATTTWSARAGRSGSAPPRSDMLTGVPAHVDGRMLAITEDAGARVVNRDRMWHYVEGIAELGPDLARPRHPDPARPVVAVARRAAAAGCPRRCSPASTRSARWTICGTPAYDHSWFVLTQKIIEKEFALSGSEQNPDLTGKQRPRACSRPGHARCPGPVEAFMDHGDDFVRAPTILPSSSTRMNALTDRRPCSTPRTSSGRWSSATARSTTPSPRTPRSTAIRGARRYRGDRLIRARHPHMHPRPRARPARSPSGCSVLTRKTLGGLQTDLSRTGAGPGRRAHARGCMPRARSPGSAAAACTATGRSRAPSSAAASSPAGSPGGPRRLPPGDGRRSRAGPLPA